MTVKNIECVQSQNQISHIAGVILKLFQNILKVSLDETHLQLVGYEQDCPAFSNPHDSVLEDVGAHTGIDSAEWIIQEKNGPLTVEGPSQA